MNWVVGALSALPALGAGFVALEVWRTAHRPDLPSFTNQDISGVFGPEDAPPLRIVAVGDSSLTAPGIADLDDVWLRRIARSYADRHRVELISLGVGGSRARDVLDGQLEAAVALEPDVAVVTVGGNDAIRGTPVGPYAAALEQIIGRLEAAAGGVLVIGIGDLGAIPRLPPSLRPYLSRRSRLFDEACARVAVRHPRAVKAHTRRPAGVDFRDDPALFAGDQFHASAAGHALFADSIGPAFAAAYDLARRNGRALD